MKHKVYWALKVLNFDPSMSAEKRKLQLLELEEMRQNAYESSKNYKERIKRYHNQKLLKREFYPGQHILQFNSIFRLFPGNLKSKWSGPFIVKEVKPHGVVELMDLDSKDTEKSWV